MNFPILHIPVVGDGMTIALNAVLHVCISHGLAIGILAMLLAAWIGYRILHARRVARLATAHASNA